jgi:hypothetical protein
MILFSTKAKYISLTNAVTNVMWARRILNKMNIQSIVLEKTDLDEDNQLIIIFSDDQKVIKLINNFVFQKRIKLITIKYHYIKNLISQDKINLEYWQVIEMITDDLIKSLWSIKFQRFVNQLNMIIKKQINI